MSTFKLLLLFLSFGGQTALQWQTEAESTTEVCLSGSIIMGWRYSMNETESISWWVQWQFSSSNSTNNAAIIAFYMFGVLSVMPPYGNRITHVENGTIELTGVTLADGGTYSMEVISRTATGLKSIRRFLFVAVKDPADYKNDTIKLEVLDVPPNPDYRETFRMYLTCGPLAWRDLTTIAVIWKTPSGKLLNSTDYQNASFILTLWDPVEPGIYTCGLPNSALKTLCLSAGDPLMKESTLMVDYVDAKLAVLEARADALDQYRLNLSQQLVKAQEEHTAYIRDLNETDMNLERYKQRDRNRARVGFHASLSSNRQLNHKNRVVFNQVFYNAGNAYNSGNGIFTAPRNGNYFFTVVVSAHARGYFCDSRLIANNVAVAWMNSTDGYDSNYYDLATGHALVSLTTGSTVYVESWRNKRQFYIYSTFNGFLVDRPYD